MKPRAPLIDNSQRPVRKIRIWLLAGFAAVLVYLAFSIRHVPPGEIGVRAGGLLPAAASVVEPGWHVIPRGLATLTTYPGASATVSFGLPEPVSLLTPEGSKVVASGRIEYRILAARAVELHDRCGGDVEGFLRGQVSAALAQTITNPALSPLTRERIPKAAAAGRQALEAAVDPAGVTIEDLVFDTLGYEGSAIAASTPHPSAKRKLLWLAIDSFDWSVIDPLLQAGRMPHLSRLMADGAWGNLQSITPTLSPVVWTSVATGKRPEKHGIFDFVASDPKTGAVLPVTSTLRRTNAFWNILSDAGLSLGVIAWWASFPAEHIDGFMATDRIAYQLFKGRIKESAGDDPLKTYPADLYREIAPLIQQPSSVSHADLSRFLDIDRHAGRFSQDDWSRVNDLQTVVAATRTYVGIGMKLFSERPTDVRVIYFEGPDTASHLFMPFVQPAVVSVAAEKGAWFGGVVPEYYVFQDELIGRFVDAFADEQTTVVICSDHGFKTGSQRPDTDSRIGHGKAADWHTREGMLVLSGKDIRKGTRILGASVLDLVPTVLALYGMPVASDMDGKVLTAALSDQFLSEHPVATIATYDTGQRPDRAEVAGLQEDAQELMEKLKSLGYVEQDKPTARINEGAVFMQSAEYSKAIEAFKSALARMDEDAVRLSLARAYRLNKEPEKAREQLDMLESRGFSKAAILTERSVMRREERDWDGAAALLTQALAADPNYAEAHLHFARLYEQQERWDEALSSYRKASALDPSSAEAYNQIGILLAKRGRTQEAITALTKSIELNPDLPGPYNNLGLIYRETGDKSRAREILKTGITMAPRSPILHNSLGSLLHDAGEIEPAISEFEAALDCDAEYVEALSNLAVVYQDRRDAAKVAEYLGRLIRIEPGNDQARLSLSLALLAQGRMDDAVSALEDLTARNPKNAKGLVMLGEIRLKQGKPKEAAGFLEKASQIDAKVPRIWNNLAQCYLAMGRRDEARRALKSSLSLDPKQPEISRRLAEIGG